MHIHHETVSMQKAIPAAPTRVFLAYVDTKAREAWSAPGPDTEVRITHADVRTGGSEVGLCGTRGEELNWRMVVAYHLVLEPNLIAFTEELWEGDKMLTIALITFDLQQAADGTTLLHLTDQITSFVGEDGVKGHRDGYARALDNLVARFSENHQL